MQLGDFTAHVIVDEKELEEYDVVIDNATKVTCWIASEEGKKFRVKWQCHAQTRLMGASGDVMVDGISCGRHRMHPGLMGVGDTKSLSSIIYDTKERDLMFSRLRLSDDDALLHKEVSKDLGNISLTISHGMLVKSPRRRLRTELCMPDDKFHEKSKKATVHRVGFGPEREREHLPKFLHRLIPSGDPPLVFVFKYRPLDVLQANGIAPKPDSASSSSRHEIKLNECKIKTQDDAYTEDIKPVELDGRIQSLENELKRLRSLQTGTSEDRKKKRVKKEEPGVGKRPTFAPGEVIDLT
ncbi:hypothetical protein BS17DRAFT_781226 [Gyrodon lividus]|nr:hypothetical protein BS17DRAFT_781226 [Gyrodon lividus]